MERSGITVLLVDDDEDIRELVRIVLERAGLRVVDDAIDGPAALLLMGELNPPPIPTVIVLDNLMPGLTGLEVAERVLEQFPGQRIVLFSAYLTDEIVRRAGELGISACVSKADFARLPELIAGVVAGS